MKKLFVVLLTAVMAITLMLSGCTPPDAKGPQAWWEGTLALGAGKKATFQVVNANGSLGQIETLTDGAKIRAILDSGLASGSKVSLCRGTKLMIQTNNHWYSAIPMSGIQMISNQIITDFGIPDPGCPCFMVYANFTVPTPVTVWNLAENKPTMTKMTVEPGTTVVLCACIEMGTMMTAPNTIIFVPSDGGGSSSATPCIVEAPMNVSVTGRVGMTAGTVTDPDAPH